MKFPLRGQTFILSPSRALFWEEQAMLILSDAHFSKESHFRKNGIAVPAGILQSDLKTVDRLIQQHHPTQIVFLGDMFHSEENEGLNEFLTWRKKNTALKCILVEGNHDILDRSWYIFAGIELVPQQLRVGDFVLTHDQAQVGDGDYNFSGHVHPCVLMRGKAKQSLRLPCFWFGKNHGILPAFGSFTGTHAVRPKKSDTVFAVGDNEIFRLQ